MTATPTRRRWPGIAGFIITILCLAGCATSTGLPGAVPQQGPGAARTAAGQALAPEAARALVTIGQSRQADVAAALGPALAIPFDSGHAVWVYRWPGADRAPGAATELVLLFDPAGLLAKVRLRPGVAPPRP